MVEKEFSEPSEDFQFCAQVAAFGMKLRSSQFINGYSFQNVIQSNENVNEPTRKEFYELVSAASQLK